MLSEAIVGLKLIASGVQSTLRLDKTSALAVTDTHGKFQEAVLSGNVYFSAIQAGTTLGTALTASAVTLTLYNPSGSGVNLVLLEGTLGLTTGLAAAGAATVVYAVNVNNLAAVPATTTAGVVRNALLSSATGKGVTYTVATLPAAPVVARVMANFRVIGATPVSEYGAQFIDVVDGKIILPPNTAVTIQNIGTAVSGICSLLWEEVPIT